MHTCPLSSGWTPHVGGPVSTPGGPTVIIGGMPAATVGSMCVCATGPPDSIVKGSASVMIASKPAARLGDNTSHGGVIVAGCPTVLIGDVGMGGPQATTMSAAKKSGAAFCEECEAARQAAATPPAGPIQASLVRTGDGVAEVGSVEGSVGSQNNPLGAVSFKGSGLKVEGNLEGTSSAHGAGGEANLGGAVVSGSTTHTGNNPFGSHSVTLEGSGLEAGAHASGFIGQHETKFGFAGSASAGASAVSGSVSGSKEIKIPFTNKSIEFLASTSGSAGSVGIGGSAHAYYDTATERAHAGIGGEAAKVFGIDFSLGVSFGKVK